MAFCNQLPSKPQNKKTSSYLLYLLFFLLLPFQTWASHTETDSCPDVETNDGQSLDFWFYDRLSGEAYSDGQIVPLNTSMYIDALATAYGSCTIFRRNFGGECEEGRTYQRAVNHISSVVTIESNGSLNGQYSDGYVWGTDPVAGGTVYSYQELDSRDDTTTTGTMRTSTTAYSEAIYRWNIVEFIGTTICELSPGVITKSFTLYSHDFSNDKDAGAPPCSGTASNPCNVATGNKYQPEVDYLDPLSTLTFIRHYNSQLALVDFKLGYGWTSSVSMRLEKYANSTVIRARRADGKSEPFNLAGSVWQGDPDNTLSLVQDATGYTLKLKDDSTERYDLTGRIVTDTDRNGSTRTYSYNTNGRLDKVTDAYGRMLSFTYTSDGHLDTLVKPSGEIVRYFYDSNLNLQRAEYSPDNVSRTYHYDDPRTTGFFKHYLTGITDERDIRYATFEYNDQFQVSASYHAGNAIKVNISYNLDGTRVLTNSKGNTTTYTTVKQHGVTLVTNKVGAGCSTCGQSNVSYQYDPNNNNLLSKNKNAITTEYGNYDANGNYRYKIEAKGTAEERRTDYSYDPRFHSRVATLSQASVAAGKQKLTTNTYDDYGNLTSVTVSGFKPDGSSVSTVATYQYNGPLHQLSQYDGPRTDVIDITTLDYYPYVAGSTTAGPNNGRLLRVTGPDTGSGRIVMRDNILYANTGKVLAEDRPNGLNLSYTYYPGNDRLETITQLAAAQSQTTRWTYLPSGEVASITQGDGSADATTLTFGYDDARRLVRITDGLGNYIEYTLDTEGNKEAEKVYDNLGQLKKQLTQTFDIYNQLDMTTQENQSHNDNYAANGELASSVDGNNTSTDYGYDALSRLVKTTQNFGGTAPETTDTISEFDYDSQGNLTTVIDPRGNITNYVYDDLGNLLAQMSPDTGTTSFSHDLAGNIIGKQDANANTFTYSYDSLNRLTSVDTLGTADDISYGYDTCANGEGRLCNVTLNGELTSYGYDGFGNITSHQGISYTYDGTNRITTITYPSGAVVTYDYNSAGHVTQVSLNQAGQSQILANGINYAPFGPLNTISYGNGLSRNQSLDLAYRLTSFNSPGALSVNTIQYDGNGNLTGRLHDASQENFGYDALNRLDTATGIFGVNDYDYDRNGNRIQQVADSVTITNYNYLPTSNKLTSDTSWSYSLDPNGNTLDKLDSDGLGWKYTYSSHNRLSNVTERAITGWEGHGNNQTPIYGDVVVGTYSYNGLGQRVNKDVSGTVTQFAYGLSGELLAEQSGSNRKEYIYLNGQLLSMLELSEQTTPPAGEETIIDDGDIGTTSSGSWTIKNDRKGNDYNADHLFASGDTGSAYRWTPTLTAGNYDVYARWISNNKYSDSVPYSVVHSGLTIVSNQDQTGSSGQWILLGTYSFSGDGTEYVEVSDSNGQTTADAVRFVKQVPPQLVAKIYYAHNDHLGTPQRLSDESGTVAWAAQYDPFGAASVDQDPDGDGVNVVLNQRFPGQYYDEESGLHYNYYRYYDPSAGRYITSDPIGLDGGLNTYGYVMGNPLKYSDQYGLEPWDWDGTGNTSICKYYAELAKKNPDCGYFPRAAEICRGGDGLVNLATNMGIFHSWLSGNTTQSQSEIYDNLRQKLMFYDKQTRQSGKIDNEGCTCGDSVDFYHDQALEESGINQWFYGGNVWPQNTYPNPVSYDPRGSEPKDDWFN